MLSVCLCVRVCVPLLACDKEALTHRQARPKQQVALAQQYNAIKMVSRP